MIAISQAFLNGLMLGAIYVVTALGLTLVFGIMHIVNFAHGEIYMLGAYAMWLLFASLHLNYFLALILSMIVMFALGTLLEGVFFARFPGRAGLFKSLIVCLGLMAIAPNSISIGFSPLGKSLPTVFKGTQHFFGVHFTNERLMAILFSAVLVIALFLFLKQNKSGRAMVAVEQDADAAQLMGVSIGRVRLLCMGIGCALAGAAAGIVSPILGANPWMGEGMIMNAFIIIIIGGMGSLPGAVLGGLILGLWQGFGPLLIDPPLVSLVAFLMVIVVMLIRPTGLLGHA